MPGTLVWYRNDLRLADNPALYHATERNAPVIPVFIWAPEEAGDWAPGGAHRWWLHQSLLALSDDLQAKTSNLVLRSGSSLDHLQNLIEETGADCVMWNRRYEPTLAALDDEIMETLAGKGIEVRTFESRILHDPQAIETSDGGPYRVYTPFWNRLQEEMEVGDPLPVPQLGDRLAPQHWPESETVDDFGLTPEDQDGTDWAEQIAEFWRPGEKDAHRRLKVFLDDTLIRYDDDRDRPHKEGTSMLSPHLHWGEITPRQIWTRVNTWVNNAAMRGAADAYLSEIAWREFAYHVLVHNPDTPTKPLHDKYEAFPWVDDDVALERWQKGQTGYPLIDAGMRQLYSIGWMHNRLRMIVASFLTKDLLIRWQHGATWFWDTLVDGDLANNTLGWQWSAGCGADAQPFFRVFNPVSQSEQHDPDGEYIKRWVPELADVPAKYVHAPWDAPPKVLEKAGVTLGETYPEPIVDHAEAREKALEAYEKVKG